MASADSMENGSSSNGREDRAMKLKHLRELHAASAKANREALGLENVIGKTAKPDANRRWKQINAEFRLEKQEARENGEDIERKRAWDWTLEQSDSWNEKLEMKRAKAMENAEFFDLSQRSKSKYERLVEALGPVSKNGAKSQQSALETAQSLSSSSRQLNTYDEADRNELEFMDMKLPSESVDRLVANIKAEESHAASRREHKTDDDVTYINERNKVFNRKLSRHLDEYTKDIHEALERGSAT